MENLNKEKSMVKRNLEWKLEEKSMGMRNLEWKLEEK
jgi:hypothetical protein